MIDHMKNTVYIEKRNGGELVCHGKRNPPEKECYPIDLESSDLSWDEIHAVWAYGLVYDGTFEKGARIRYLSGLADRGDVKAIEELGDMESDGDFDEYF